jgi:uncharacterized membrane protein (DUF106 family)
MLESLNQATLHLMDRLLGWLLDWPTDVAIVAVAVATSLVLVVVRRFATDQDLLGRVANDKRWLKQLAADARRRGDDEAARRHRANRSLVTLRSMPRLMRGEALTLVVSLVPIVLVATWCFYRLEYHPSRVGDVIEVAVSTPLSAVGQVAHAVPQEGLSADSGWVRPVMEDSVAAGGIATWTLRAAGPPAEYRLIFRVGDRSVEHPLIVGQRTYAAPRIDHGDALATEVRLREVKLFDRLSGLPHLYLPAWMVAYLVIAIASTWVLKRCCGIR